MLIAALLSTNSCPTKTRLAIILTLAAGLLASGCGGGSLAESYRKSSDWLNDVPPLPAVGPWRLLKHVQDQDAPYPNLGDVAPRPVAVVSPEETREQVRLLEEDARRSADPATAKQVRSTIVPGVPPRARVAPVQIPTRSR